MAKVIDIDNDKEKFIQKIQKAVQSVNLNFLIGSGCSYPAIAVLGAFENELQNLIDEGKNNEAEEKVFCFFKPFLDVSLNMSSTDQLIVETLANYKDFLSIVSEVLFQRENNILPRQATIFSTNYDLFIEKAFEEIDSVARLHDGFSRSPLLNSRFTFSTTEFFNSVYNNGNLYNYQVQIPTINLIKLHGSLSWTAHGDDIVFSVSDLQKRLDQYSEIVKKDVAEKAKFNAQFSIVLPNREKYYQSILDQTYYDLLRLYANELDKENTLLVTEGFSFEDKHIASITYRALKNPTLKIVIFCFATEDLESFKNKFAEFDNVEIVCSGSDKITFSKFNQLMTEIMPVSREPKTQRSVRERG